LFEVPYSDALATAVYRAYEEDFDRFQYPRSLPHSSDRLTGAAGSTDFEMRADNHFWVPIEGEWRQVPAESVVHNAGNPVGEAMVWYVRQGPSEIYIRSFVPGEGV
jgi:hypothetical protein